MSTVIFHGTALPDRDWAGRLEADVVLQPYHPIVQAQSFGDWFPQARRFVYVNPTAVDRLRRPEVTEDMVFLDPSDRWKLPRLRLPDWLDWAIADAAVVGTAPGVDGLFVDDLDRLLQTSGGRDLAIDYVRRVVEATGGGMYINRAFSILDHLPNVEAVLIEDLDRSPASPGVERWLRDVVLPVLNRLRNRGARIHRLEYGNDPGRHGFGSAALSLLDSCAASVARLPDPDLDHWSWWCADRDLIQTPRHLDEELQ